MLTAEDLKQIAEVMEGQLAPIKEDISGLKNDVAGLKNDVVGLKNDVAEIKERLDIIEEDTRETRGVVNEIVKWIDTYFRPEYAFPVKSKMD